MNVLRLTEKEVFDTQIESRYAFIKSLKETTGMHCHDYYELFLIVHGSVIHNVNSKRQPLIEGSLVFIRPDDVHFYEKDGKEDCQIINIPFPSKTMQAIFDFLGEGFIPERLLKPDIPPVVILSPEQKNAVKNRLEEINILPITHKSQIKTELRAFVIELFIKYFSLNTWYKKSILPEWLMNLCSQMQKKENFVEGLPAMQYISGKTPEHLCRSFNKYLSKTPTQFINDLRLNYAANLLINSDEDIISISMHAGFDNLSHFYHLFKDQFSLPPGRYRKKYQKNLL